MIISQWPNIKQKLGDLCLDSYCTDVDFYYLYKKRIHFMPNKVGDGGIRKTNGVNNSD